MADLVDDLTLKQREIDALRGAPIVRVLPYAVTPDGKILPGSPSGGEGGNGGAGSAREVTLQAILSRTPLQLIPLGNHITLALDGTARAPTWPPGTLGAEIGVSGGSARVAVTAPEPTSTTGRLWADGSYWELSQGDIAGFKAIAATGSPVLDIQPLGAP